jgi:hypothetical protein
MLEIFGSRVYSQIRPAWVGDLGIRPKNSKFWWFRLENRYFVLLALSPTLLKSVRRCMLVMALKKFKRCPSCVRFVLLSIPLSLYLYSFYCSYHPVFIFLCPMICYIYLLVLLLSMSRIAVWMSILFCQNIFFSCCVLFLFPFYMVTICTYYNSESLIFN